MSTNVKQTIAVVIIFTALMFGYCSAKAQTNRFSLTCYLQQDGQSNDDLYNIKVIMDDNYNVPLKTTRVKDFTIQLDYDHIYTLVVYKPDCQTKYIVIDTHAKYYENILYECIIDLKTSETDKIKYAGDIFYNTSLNTFDYFIRN